MEPELKNFMIIMLELVRLMDQEWVIRTDEDEANWDRLQKDVLKLQNKLMG